MRPAWSISSENFDFAADFVIFFFEVYKFGSLLLIAMFEKVRIVHDAKNSKKSLGKVRIIKIFGRRSPSRLQFDGPKTLITEIGKCAATLQVSAHVQFIYLFFFMIISFP